MQIVRTVIRRYGTPLWLVLILALSAWFIFFKQSELSRIANTLQQSQREWVLALVAIEIVILALIAGSYRSLLSRLGHRVNLDTLMGVHLKRVVVGTVSPLGGPPSMAIFVHALRRRGVRPADALLAVSLKSVIGNVAFLLLLIPVLAFQSPSLPLYLCSLALLLMVGVMTTSLFLLLRSAKPPQWLLHRLPRKAMKFVAQARQHDVSVASLIGPFVMVLATKLAGVLMLFVALQAVGANPEYNVPLIAYVVGMVFMLVAPVFQGIGFVEVGMAVALQKLGVPAPAAVGATLLCRAGELWLPLAAGIVFQSFETLAHRAQSDPPAMQPIA